MLSSVCYKSLVQCCFHGYRGYVAVNRLIEVEEPPGVGDLMVVLVFLPEADPHAAVVLFLNPIMLLSW